MTHRRLAPQRLIRGSGEKLVGHHVRIPSDPTALNKSAIAVAERTLHLHAEGEGVVRPRASTLSESHTYVPMNNAPLKREKASKEAAEGGVGEGVQESESAESAKPAKESTKKEKEDIWKGLNVSEGLREEYEAETGPILRDFSAEFPEPGQGQSEMAKSEARVPRKISDGNEVPPPLSPDFSDIELAKNELAKNELAEDEVPPPPPPDSPGPTPSLPPLSLASPISSLSPTTEEEGPQWTEDAIAKYQASKEARIHEQAERLRERSPSELEEIEREKRSAEKANRFLGKSTTGGLPDKAGKFFGSSDKTGLPIDVIEGLISGKSELEKIFNKYKSAQMGSSYEKKQLAAQKFLKAMKNYQRENYYLKNNMSDEESLFNLNLDRVINDVVMRHKLQSLNDDFNRMLSLRDELNQLRDAIGVATESYREDPKNPDKVNNLISEYIKMVRKLSEYSELTNRLIGKDLTARDFKNKEDYINELRGMVSTSEFIDTFCRLASLEYY